MFVAIYTTFPNLEKAKVFGRLLVVDRLAACVNIFPNITSIYRWNGKIEEDQEVIVWLKTRETLIEEVHEKLIKIHSYEVPAFVVYKILTGSEEYLQWIKTETHSYTSTEM